MFLSLKNVHLKVSLITYNRQVYFIIQSVQAFDMSTWPICFVCFVFERESQCFILRHRVMNFDTVMKIYTIQIVTVMMVIFRWRKDHGEASTEEESEEEKSGSGSDDSDSDDDGVIIIINIKHKNAPKNTYCSQ